MFATGALQHFDEEFYDSMMRKWDTHGKPCNIQVALSHGKAQDLQQQMLEREKDHKAMSLGEKCLQGFIVGRWGFASFWIPKSNRYYQISSFPSPPSMDAPRARWWTPVVIVGFCFLAAEWHLHLEFTCYAALLIRRDCPPSSWEGQGFLDNVGWFFTGCS